MSAEVIIKCHGCMKMVYKIISDLPHTEHATDNLYCKECYQALEEEIKSMKSQAQETPEPYDYNGSMAIPTFYRALCCHCEHLNCDSLCLDNGRCCKQKGCETLDRLKGRLEVPGLFDE